MLSCPNDNEAVQIRTVAHILGPPHSWTQAAPYKHKKSLLAPLTLQRIIFKVCIDKRALDWAVLA